MTEHNQAEIQVEQKRMSIRDHTHNADVRIGEDTPTITVETGNGYVSVRLSYDAVARVIDELEAHR